MDLLKDTSRNKNGVYCIKNAIDRRLYIGSTVLGFYDRFKSHLYFLRKNQHGNAYLQAFVNKHGEDKLIFEILEIVEDKEKVLEREQAWIDQYWETGLLFNTARDAKAPMLGRKLTEESKKKMSQSQKGNTYCLGHKKSDETKKKTSLALKGNVNCLGHKHTEKSKEKMRKSRLTFLSKREVK